jgi:hypothetical protein
VTSHRQRLRSGAALALALGLCGGLLLQSPALAGGRPLLVEGRLRNAGRAAQGTIQVYVKGYRSTDGRDRALQMLARIRTASDGSFAIRLAHDARLEQLGRSNGGYVDFSVFAFDGRHVATSAFSRRFDGLRWLSAHAEEPLTVDLAKGRDDPALAQRMPRCIVWPSFVKSGNYWTDIGEYHSTKNMSGTFTYGKTSDSDISVGISYDFGGSWSTGAWAIPPDSGRRIRTIFEYDWNDWYCDYIYIDTEVSAAQWNGSQAIGDDIHSLDYLCDDKHAQFENTIVEGGSFDRVDKDFVTFSWVAKVFGFNAYTSQNGASTWVQLHLHADKYSHVICGNNDFPVRSQRIYAGK